MADYGYTGRGFVPQERNGYDAWDTRNSGVKTYSEGWGKTGFASNGEAVRDHVCRPVIIDAQGRKRPVIACTPENKMDNFDTKTETIIEQVYAPEVARYGNPYPRNVAPVKEYGAFNNGWSRPVSPERPTRVEEFISQVQTETSRPSRTGLVSSSHWRQKLHSNGHGGLFGHGRNSVNTAHQPHFEGRNEMAPDFKQEPAIITEGGWTRPSRTGWAAPTSLTKPTNDIGTAVDYLKEAAMSQSAVNMAPTQRRFTIPTPMVPKLETFSPAIDSRDALRRYGGLGGPQVINTADSSTYSSALDSREAARRYHGLMM